MSRGLNSGSSASQEIAEVSLVQTPDEIAQPRGIGGSDRGRYLFDIVGPNRAVLAAQRGSVCRWAMAVLLVEQIETHRATWC